jgi:hypothetical protein
MSYYPCYQVNYGGCGPQLQFVPQGVPYVPPSCPTGPTGAGGSIGPIGPTGGKTFIIDHPIDAERYLVHGCLEGPEFGIYYRGIGVIEEGLESVGIQLPNYVEKIGVDFTVQITPIFSGQRRKDAHEATEVQHGAFVVYGPPGRFYWHVYAKRSSVEVEPLRRNVEVKGSGPYQWM